MGASKDRATASEEVCSKFNGTCQECVGNTNCRFCLTEEALFVNSDSPAKSGLCVSTDSAASKTSSSKSCLAIIPNFARGQTCYDILNPHLFTHLLTSPNSDLSSQRKERIASSLSSIETSSSTLAEEGTEQSRQRQFAQADIRGESSSAVNSLTALGYGTNGHPPIPRSPVVVGKPFIIGGTVGAVFLLLVVGCCFFRRRWRRRSPQRERKNGVSLCGFGGGALWPATNNRGVVVVTETRSGNISDGRYSRKATATDNPDRRNLEENVARHETATASNCRVSGSASATNGVSVPKSVDPNSRAVLPPQYVENRLFPPFTTTRYPHAPHPTSMHGLVFPHQRDAASLANGLDPSCYWNRCRVAEYDPKANFVEDPLRGPHDGTLFHPLPLFGQMGVGADGRQRENRCYNYHENRCAQQNGYGEVVPLHLPQYPVFANNGSQL